MRRKIYDYFAERPYATHRMCANTLEIKESEVLKVIKELRKDGLLEMQVLPLGNEIDPNCSNFYSVCERYHD